MTEYIPYTCSDDRGTYGFIPSILSFAEGGRIRWQKMYDAYDPLNFLFVCNELYEE